MWGRTCWSLVEGSVEGKRIFMKTWWAMWALYLLKNSMSVCHHIGSTAWHRRPLVAKDTGVVLCLEDLNGQWDATDARGQESLPESLLAVLGWNLGILRILKISQVILFSQASKVLNNLNLSTCFVDEATGAQRSYILFWALLGCVTTKIILEPTLLRTRCQFCFSLSCMLGIDYRRCLEGKLITIIFLALL